MSSAPVITFDNFSQKCLKPTLELCSGAYPSGVLAVLVFKAHMHLKHSSQIQGFTVTDWSTARKSLPLHNYSGDQHSLSYVWSESCCTWARAPTSMIFQYCQEKQNVFITQDCWIRNYSHYQGSSHFKWSTCFANNLGKKTELLSTSSDQMYKRNDTSNHSLHRNVV